MAVMIVIGIGAMSVVLTLMEEGAPGVIVSGIAIVSVVVLLVLAWQFESALLLLLLVSFLAVAAVRHWLDKPLLLWSAALVLVACALLTVAQVRPFHPDPGGTSSALQLVPLVWMLVVLAVGIAFAQATRRFVAREIAPAFLAAVLVTISLVLPTWDHIRTSDREHTALANPAILAPVSELEAASWLTQNVAGTPVILTSDGPGPGSVGTISAIIGFPTVIGSNEVQRNTRPGWSRMVEHRTMDVTTIYTGMRDWPMVSPLIGQYDIRYIVLGSEERDRFGNMDQDFAVAESNGHLEVVFEYDDVVIYRVVSAPSGVVE